MLVVRTRFGWAVILAGVCVVAAGCQSPSAHNARHNHPTTTGGSAASTSTVPPQVTVLTVAPTTTTTLPPGPLAPVVDHVKTTAPVVFITIDDGYGRDPRVIALVRLLHLPITAFVIRGPALAGRAYWQALQAAGATIEDHTITHPDLRRFSLAAQRHEICSPLDEFALLFGHRPTLFRPPYGDYDAATRWVTASCGLRAVVLWRATMIDGHLAIQGRHFRAGDIILLHWRPSLYDDLSRLVVLVQAQHFTVGRLETSITPADLSSPGRAPVASGD
jgi:peptidoglycan/xylan/chitin deacetylase (PgdA/CDA1 family)